MEKNRFIVSVREALQPYVDACSHASHLSTEQTVNVLLALAMENVAVVHFVPRMLTRVLRSDAELTSLAEEDRRSTAQWEEHDDTD